MLVDSHCHLEYPGLAERRGEVLANARAAGVGAFLNISTKASEWEAVLATADCEPDVYATIGVHPHNADGHAELSADELRSRADHPRVIGLGETGLDYHYDRSDRAAQQALFCRHIAVSRETGLPVIIHTRDAEADTAAILAEEMAAGAFPALIHCFTASTAFGERMLALGLTISLSGIVTFKNARELAHFAASIPGDRLLIETDSPFLAPVPHRGRVCEPAFVADTARFIAARRGVSEAELAAQTTANFYRLFTKAAA
ncbi:TatD family hydrolase [Qipengyuania sediminis]|uniref:TatD family hydrolase n=1 Tax=Qipengyuania sediminis TaxID=1532023 RepID=UPI0010592C2B|nr:TatD family hydrolase [Qipengyuania sediminis]